MVELIRFIPGQLRVMTTMAPGGPTGTLPMAQVTNERHAVVADVYDERLGLPRPTVDGKKSPKEISH